MIILNMRAIECIKDIFEQIGAWLSSIARKRLWRELAIKKLIIYQAIRIEHDLMNQLDQFCNEYFNRR